MTKRPTPTPTETDRLLSHLNAAGFAFQLAVEETVRVTGLDGEHAWAINSREHGWQDGENARFVDLVLTREPVHLVMELKRMRGADADVGRMMFLVPDPPTGRRAEPRRHFRAAYLRNIDTPNGPEALTSLYNFQLDPRSWESSFCVVPGGSENDKHPLLDRICAELARSADAILTQQLAIEHRREPSSRAVIMPPGRPWMAIPVVVTTARLHVVRFDPAAVALKDGMLPAGVGTWEEVPHVRYRKSFVAPEPLRKDTVGELEKYAQRSIVIVTAEHLVEWLRNFVIEETSRN